MTDYKCPSCSGGFPETAANEDECPWCGKALNESDDSDDSNDGYPFINRDPLPGTAPPAVVENFLDDIDAEEPRLWRFDDDYKYPDVGHTGQRVVIRDD